MKDIHSYIDHTLLRPTCTDKEIRTLCEEAITHQFAAVCVPPVYVALAHRLLEGTKVRTATVIGFPLGYHDITIKVAEIKKAYDHGADEVDVVINQCNIKNGDWDSVRQEVEYLHSVTALYSKKIDKIIIETAHLSDEELGYICNICIECGVGFIKTSTGFAERGASVEDVEKIKKYADTSSIGIKASGGIRTFADAKRMIEAGATRIGTSSGISIVQNIK